MNRPFPVGVRGAARRVAPVLAVLLAGCGGPPLASVEGTVTLAGRPLADVEVQFIPDPALGTRGPPASAYTDAAGKYRIVADGTAGVVVGRHRVCLNDATLMMPGGGEGGERAGPRRSRLPAEYSDATRTPFKDVEVQPGTQTRDFALTTTP